MLAKKLARTIGKPWPLVQYELKRLIALAMLDPDVAAQFPQWPTPEQFFGALKKSHK